MSLILAEESQNFGWFVGDTLLTKGFLVEHSDSDINNESHALKIHILHEKLCIAFAGQVTVAISLINHVSRLIEDKMCIQDDHLFDKICEIYKELCSKEELNLCDFLIMVIRENENVLIRIEKGEWSRYQKAYIGDSEFYRKLQNTRVPYQSLSPVYASDGSHTFEPTVMSDAARNFVEVGIAMQKISGRAIVGLIGDNVVRVGINSNNAFSYFETAYGYVSVENTEVKKRIEANLLTSSNPKFGIGIYYSEGGVGYIFISGDTEYCRRIQAHTISDFKTKAKSFFLNFN